MLPEAFVNSTRMQVSREIDPVLASVKQTAKLAYSVEGRTDTYIVNVDVKGFHCSCKAGVNDRACWHIASVYRLRQAERNAKALNTEPVAPAPVKPKFDLMAAYDKAGILI